MSVESIDESNVLTRLDRPLFFSPSRQTQTPRPKPSTSEHSKLLTFVGFKPTRDTKLGFNIDLTDDGKLLVRRVYPHCLFAGSLRPGMQIVTINGIIHRKAPRRLPWGPRENSHHHYVDVDTRLHLYSTTHAQRIFRALVGNIILVVQPVDPGDDESESDGVEYDTMRHSPNISEQWTGYSIERNRRVTGTPTTHDSTSTYNQNAESEDDELTIMLMEELMSDLETDEENGYRDDYWNPNDDAVSHGLSHEGGSELTESEDPTTSFDCCDFLSSCTTS